MSKPNTENSSASSTQRVAHGKTTEERPTRYVVVREGRRVSDRDYETASDPNCIAEVSFWKNVARNHSHGEKVEAVLYDSKSHRVW